MDIQDFINNALKINSFETYEESPFVLSEGQTEVLNIINNNDDVLIKKDRCTGVTTLLAAYVAYEILTLPNRIYVYIAPNTNLRYLFMLQVYQFVDNAIKHLYNDFHSIIKLTSTRNKLFLNNGSKLICGANNALTFHSIQYINTIIYDEVGFDRTNFNSLIKTIELYKNIKSLKTIFTLTEKERDKYIDIPNKNVEIYFKGNKDITTVDIDTLSHYKQKIEEQYLYDKIKEVYGE